MGENFSFKSPLEIGAGLWSGHIKLWEPSTLLCHVKPSLLNRRSPPAQITITLQFK